MFKKLNSNVKDYNTTEVEPSEFSQVKRSIWAECKPGAI